MKVLGYSTNENQKKKDIEDSLRALVAKAHPVDTLVM